MIFEDCRNIKMEAACAVTCKNIWNVCGLRPRCFFYQENFIKGLSDSFVLVGEGSGKREDVACEGFGMGGALNKVWCIKGM